MAGPDQGGNPQDATFEALTGSLDLRGPDDFGPKGEERVTDPELAHEAANAAAPHMDVVVDAHQATAEGEQRYVAAADSLAGVATVEPAKQAQYDGAMRGLGNTAAHLGSLGEESKAIQEEGNAAAIELAQRKIELAVDNVNETAGRVLNSFPEEQRAGAVPHVNEMIQASIMQGAATEAANVAQNKADAAAATVLERPAQP